MRRDTNDRICLLYFHLWTKRVLLKGPFWSHLKTCSNDKCMCFCDSNLQVALPFGFQTSSELQNGAFKFSCFKTELVLGGKACKVLFRRELVIWPVCMLLIVHGAYRRHLRRAQRDTFVGLFSALLYFPKAWNWLNQIALFWVEILPGKWTRKFVVSKRATCSCVDFVFRQQKGS